MKKPYLFIALIVFTLYGCSTPDANDDSCNSDQDCAGDLICDANVCRAPNTQLNPDMNSMVQPDGMMTTPTCNDGIQNGLETGIDCGGSCGMCTSSESCPLSRNLVPFEKSILLTQPTQGDQGLSFSFTKTVRDFGDVYNITVLVSLLNDNNTYMTGGYEVTASGIAGLATNANPITLTIQTDDGQTFTEPITSGMLVLESIEDGRVSGEMKLGTIDITPFASQHPSLAGCRELEFTSEFIVYSE